MSIISKAMRGRFVRTTASLTTTGTLRLRVLWLLNLLPRLLGLRLLSGLLNLRRSLRLLDLRRSLRLLDLRLSLFLNLRSLLILLLSLLS